MFGILASTLGPMISSWIPVNPIVVVDTTNRIVAISFHVVPNITGRLDGENNSMELPHVFILHLDENHKAFKFVKCWDNNDATLQSVLTKVTAKLNMAQSATKKTMKVNTRIESGQ